MSSINSRVPPSRIAAIDSPADGEVAAYQASSGQFEWVANGSGGGGTVTSVALTESGDALIISGSPITGSGTFNISGGGSSSQVILGDLSLGTLTSGTVTSVSSSQAFITITSPTTTPSISIGNASASATGVLTSTDWNTFNNKGSGTVTSVSGTSPISSTGGATPTLSLDNSGVTAGSYTNADITVDATGRITTASNGSSGGGGTVTSVALTETGSALTITGSPITGSGTFNISGAGTSSQVILGDLSLGTLTSGTVTGTGSANQVSYWTSTTAQAGSTGLTYDPSTGNLTVGGYVETGTKVTTPSGTNLELSPGGASSGSIVIADGANGQISLNPNGTGTVKIDGVEIDNSAIATGYVLKATSTTEAGWAAESGGGGGGSGFIQPPTASGAIATNYNKYPIFSSAPYGAGDINGVSTTAYNTNPCMRPFVLGEGGTWGGAALWVDTASTSNSLLISLYESDSDGMPAAFIGYCDVPTTSTGSVTQTTTLDSGGSSASFTLTKDTQYWCSFVMANSGDGATLRSVNVDGLAGLGNSNMSKASGVLRNTSVSNAIETTNPPRNNQIIDATAPHIGLIM